MVTFTLTKIRPSEAGAAVVPMGTTDNSLSSLPGPGEDGACDVCDYCGAQRRLTARAQLAGTPGGHGDGQAGVCAWCEAKGRDYLEVAFTPPVTADAIRDEARRILAALQTGI
jgi:hypothetical protein